MSDSKKIIFMVSGIGTHVERWIKEYLRQGHNVLLIARTRMSFSHKNLVCNPFPVLSYSNPISAISYIRNALRIIKNYKPDFIHAHYLGYMLLPLIFVKKKYRIALTVWGQDVIRNKGAYKNIFDKLIKYLILKRVNYITTHSKYLEEEILSLNKKFKDKIERVYWGLDIKTHNPNIDIKHIKKKLKLPKNKFILFHIRAFVSMYNVLSIVRAIDRIKNEVPNIYLLLPKYNLEEGYYSTVNQFIEANKLHKYIQFVESIDFEDFPAFLVMSDLCISVPDADGFPISLLQSMACGTPTILSDIPDYKEMFVDSKNTIYVNPKDEIEIADAIVRFYKDKKFYQKVKEYNISKVKIIGTFENTIKSIIGLVE